MGILSSIGVPLAIVAMGIALVGVLVFVSRNYMRCPPNEVLVLYGRKHRIMVDNQSVVRGYRMITGGSAFRWPLLEQSQKLSLAVFQIAVKIEHAPNKDGVPVTVESIANVRLASDQVMLGAAVEQFLGKGAEEIKTIIHNTLEGIVRQLVGTLTIEEMVRERDKISHQVVELTSKELAKLGVKCENFVFTRVADDKKYIESLGRKRAAEVLRDAQIGEAEAEREAMEKASEAKRMGEKARLDNEAQIADANRALEVKRAQYAAEVQAEQARAALAGQIAQAERAKDLKQKEVAVQEAEVTAQIKVAEQRAQLMEKELAATQIKKAEADKKSRVIEAEAQRDAAKELAEAAKSEADATRTKADADKARVTAEGEGHAAAAAAQAKQVGLAEAEAIEAKGKAEGEATKAKLLAEATGIDAKNKALAAMSEGAKLILVLDRMPEILEQGGEALAKALTPAFQGIGAGLAAVDRIEIIDFGGGANGQDGTAVERFALAVPRIVVKMLTEGRSLGVDVEGLLAKAGIRMTKGGIPSDDKAGA